MTIQDIYNTLERYYNLATRTLTLPDNQLGPDIQQLFDAYLVGQQLVITNADIQNNTTAVLVTGTGNNLPFTGMTIAAHFTADQAGLAQLQSTITAPPSNWTLASSFPVLQGTLFSTLIYSGTQSFAFNSFNISQTAPRGLSFNGAITLSGNWALLSWLLSGQTNIPVTGPIGLVGQAPQMELTAPLGSPVDLGYFTVPIAFKLRSTPVSPAPGYGTPYAYTASELAADITFTGEGQAIILPVTAAYYDLPSLVSLSVELDNAVGATLDDLSALLNNSPLSSVLPSGWSIPNIINLKGMELLVNPATETLTSVSLEVATAQPWTVVPDLLTIEQIALTFTLLDPLNVRHNQSLQLTMAGEVALGGGLIDVSGNYPDFYFGSRLAAGTRIDLRLLAEKFFGSLPDAPSLTVTQLEFGMAPGTGLYNGAATVESDWTLSLGSVNLTVNAAYFAIDHTSDGTTGAIGGILSFGTGDDRFSLEVLWNLPGDIQLTGTLQTIKLTKLIQLLSTQSLAYTLPEIDLVNSVIFVEKDFSAGNLYFALGTQVTYNNVNWGNFEIEFLNTQNGTGFAFGFVLPDSWSLDQLSSLFDSLSWLKFQRLSLIIATVDDPTFSFRSMSVQGGSITNQATGTTQTVSAVSFPTQLQSAPAGVRAGMSFYADLLLQGNGLDSISKLLGGTTSLSLSAWIPTNYDDTTLTAALHGAFNLFQNYAVIDDLAVTIQPLRESLDLFMRMTFNLFNSSLVLSGDIVLQGSEVEFELRTETPWVNPFCIQGLTLGNMGVAFTVGTVVAFSLAGEIIVGSGASQIVLDAGMEFDIEAEGVPDVMLVREIGTIKLADIISTFTRTRVPTDLVDVEMRGFLLLIVANPNGWRDPADNKFYSFGLAFSSTLEFFGLTASFAIQASYSTGIYAQGTIDVPLRIGNVVTLASATDSTKGPYVLLNSAGPTYLSFSAKLTMFEVAALTVNAQIQSGSFYFLFDYTITQLGRVHFECYLINRNEFYFNASAAFTLSNLALTTTESKALGTLKSLALAANFTIHIGPGAVFTITLNAAFSFAGRSFTFGPVTLQGSIQHLYEIATKYASQLASQMWTICARVLQDADALFNYVGQGLLTLTSDVASILKNELHVSLTKATQLIKGVAHVLSWGINDIAGWLKSAYSASITDVASALKTAGYDVELVAQAIANAFNKGAQDVANALKAVGYDLESIASALKNTFGWAADKVAQFYKDTWHIADTVVHDALNAVGYGASEIASAMKSVFNWVSSTASTVVHYLNPKNW